ncbi:MAG: hypothetical protein ACRD0K_06205 [Egibacteraceae bacterium]
MATEISELSDFLSRVAPVFIGGGAVQAVLALSKRRGESRQLDRQTDSVAVESTERAIRVVNQQLDRAMQQIEERDTDLAERAQQVKRLADQKARLRTQVLNLQADLALARSRIAELTNALEV